MDYPNVVKTLKLTASEEVVLKRYLLDFTKELLSGLKQDLLISFMDTEAQLDRELINEVGKSVTQLMKG